MSNTKYTKSHEWLRRESDGSITVGITDFAQSELGDIVFVQLPKEGDTLAKGQQAVTIESVKAASEIEVPVSGVVVSVNAKLVNQPQLANSSAEADGWFFRLRLDSEVDIEGLMDLESYKQYLAELGK